MEIRSGALHFQPVAGSGPQTQRTSMTFSRNVDRAVAGLQGYSVGFYSEDDDHHVGKLDIRLETEISGSMVTVIAYFGLRDWSGSWDDQYTGTIHFSLFIELVPQVAVQTRQDLSIIGMEFTQAIQHYHSWQHLDPQNVQPDNSIRLVARKTTAIRVYIDYTQIPNTPAIGSVSGSLEVMTSTGSTTFTLNPLNQSNPRPHSQIDRRQQNDTLNFVIPDGWCQGELQLRCQLFDPANPAVLSSPYQCNIKFEDLQPLRIFGVGINYTGQGLNLPAPSQNDFINTMGFVESVFPIGEAFITGFTTTGFSTDMVANISDGCGDGFNDLLDVLRDMRGDSNDIYYALLPLGINSGNVGGCGGDGASAGYINDGETAAEEIGHAYGLDHAPCDNSSRCGDPADQDDDYPRYGSYPSDSIGEIGFDPNTGAVHNPAGTYDFMGYSAPAWVSPYTYKNLMSRFPTSSGTSASYSPKMLDTTAVSVEHPKSRRAEWIRKRMMTLFIGLKINRDRTVERRHSFHYPVYSSYLAKRCPGFNVEIIDKTGKVLICQPLRCGYPHCNCSKCARESCWPKIIRQPIPFPENASKIVVWDGKDKIYEEDIPDPLDVFVKAKYLPDLDEIEITWKTSEKSEDREIWYLVQWLDRPDTWRGLIPRTQKRSLRISSSNFRFSKDFMIRVLATSGIATGVGECTVTKTGTHETPNVTIQLVGQDQGGEVLLERLGIIKAVVTDEQGKSIPGAEIRWVNDRGEVVDVGRSHDLSSMNPSSSVKVVVLGLGKWACEKTWVLNYREDGRPELKLVPERTMKQIESGTTISKKQKMERRRNSKR